MVITIPESWTYKNELENLFFFYQASEEMLSYNSPDSYRLTVHNTLSLCYEIKQIYSILEESKSIDAYYSKYINPIIEELISSIHKNHIIKGALNQRLDSVITGLEKSKNNPYILNRWINIILHSCPMNQYVESCKSTIKEIVQSTNNEKKQLLWLMNEFYVCLTYMGYNEEYLYQTVVRFFDNKSNRITSSNCINTFLDGFDLKEKQYEIYFILDTYIIDNIVKSAPIMKELLSFEKIDEGKIVELAGQNTTVNVFYENYKQKSRGSSSMVSYNSHALDPYSVLEKIENLLNLFQYLNGYFKHKAQQRLYFDALLKISEERFQPIKLRGIIPNRPYIDEEVIEKKIHYIIEEGVLSNQLFETLLSALSMHLDAISCRNDNTMLRTFWTAIETLFYDPNADGERMNALSSIQKIVEKTYVLKVIRIIYTQLILAADQDRLTEIGIDSFESFVEFFAKNKYDSNEFKALMMLLTYNPLLRTKIYSLRKKWNDSEHFHDYLAFHNKTVEWQVKRIYRTRNISTHVGVAMPYTKKVLFNLHNYFDYVVNYIICTIENREYVNSISSLVFEAQNDNQIHMEYLRNKMELDNNNYKEYLFGPDKRVLKYEYEM